MQKLNIAIKNSLNIVILYCILFSHIVLAQTNIAAIQQIDVLAKNHPLESIYLQTSKGIYETGEDLWFKGYVLHSQSLQPSLLSKTLYVQLIQEKTNTAISEEKYEIVNGFVDGHLHINDSLANGNYRLTAYTPYSFYKDKQPIKSIRQLKIVKNITSYFQTKKDTTVLTKRNKAQEIDFQLFPEGGYLVSGLKSRLAFKAVNKEGESVSVKGTLYENNEPLVDFESIHDGMGSVEFTPDGSKKYHIQLSDSHNTTYNLPEIRSQGISLRLLQMTNSFLLFEVNQSEELPKSTINFRFQIRGKTYSALSAELDKSKIIKVPLNNVPQGIAEVTVFDENKRPVAERLVYVNQNRKLNVETSISDTYAVKEKATLKIKVTDGNGRPVVSHLGISIFDALYENPRDTKNIMTHYMLSTQLKGNIRNPNYYFNDDNKNRLTALNLLLLTQGWRRYVWNETNLEQEFLNKNSIINDTVIGKLYAGNKKGQALLSQQYIMAFTADNSSAKSFIEVDSIGRFKILPDYIQQAKKGYLYLKLLLSDPKTKINITVNDPSFTTINRVRQKRIFGYPEPSIQRPLTENKLRPFTVSDNINKLEEVVLTGKKKRVFRDKYMGTLDSLAKLDINSDYVCSSQGGVLNCPFPSHKHSGIRPVEGKTYTIIEVVDYSKMSFKVVKYVKYEYPKFTEAELLKKFNLATIKGYYGKKEFYSPVYDTIEQTDNFPDYRNTLFWSPDIITDENGEASIEFFCSDLNTRFKGVIEGVDGSGLLANKDFEFRVYKK